MALRRDRKFGDVDLTSLASQALTSATALGITAISPSTAQAAIMMQGQLQPGQPGYVAPGGISGTTLLIILGGVALILFTSKK